MGEGYLKFYIYSPHWHDHAVRSMLLRTLKCLVDGFLTRIFKMHRIY